MEIHCERVPIANYRQRYNVGRPFASRRPVQTFPVKHFYVVPILASAHIQMRERHSDMVSCFQELILEILVVYFCEVLRVNVAVGKIIDRDETTTSFSLRMELLSL